MNKFTVNHSIKLFFFRNRKNDLIVKNDAKKQLLMMKLNYFTVKYCHIIFYEIMVSIELVPRNILIVIFCILKTFTSFHPNLIYDKTFLISIYKRNVLFKTYIKSIAEQFTPRFNLNEITKPKYKFHYSIIIFSSFINNTFNRSLDMILYIKNLFYLYEYNYEKPIKYKNLLICT